MTRETRERPMVRERTEPGAGLARGPALIVGTILLAAGLYFLYRQHIFPPFSNAPSGRAPVTGHAIGGIFGINGWTGMLTAVAGGLLLFGAAQHLLAKTMSLIVGAALGAAAIIAAVSGDVLGLMAANGWTEVGWGVAAVILLFNVAAPRRRRVIREEAAPVATGHRPVGEPGEPRTAARREPVAPAAGSSSPASERAGVEEPATGATPVAEPGTGATRVDGPATQATRVHEPATQATRVDEPARADAPGVQADRPAEEYPLDRPLEPPVLDPVERPNRSSSDPAA